MCKFSFDVFSKRAVEDVQEAGKICVLDVDMQGIKQIKQSSLDPFYIFIKPPSIDELEKRLRARKTETEDTLQRRLSVARTEIEYGKCCRLIYCFLKNLNAFDTYLYVR